MSGRLALLLLIAIAVVSAASLPADALAILEKRCLSCHGPRARMSGLDLSTRETAIRGGTRGPAIAPSEPAKGWLLQRIAKGDMPPNAPLPRTERETLETWISAGAEWPSAIRERRAGSDWWSLQPIRVQQPPAAPGTWNASPIDRWIHARLARDGITPSPQADRRTLIRRLSLDLLGLPPTPAEIAAFESDPRPDAYDRAVDRLLSSPHYGERWARHWLDVVRFAESEGFERDDMREFAWPYRDYVIRSFNSDKSYQTFAREQIAGDLMEPATHDGIIATAILAFGPLDAVGLTSAIPRERATIREDQLEEMLGVVSQTFLGLTANCARCHDHKFDPIPQRDYYRLKAAFEGVWQPTLDRSIAGLDEMFPHGRPLLTPSERDEREGRLASLRNRIAELEARIGGEHRRRTPRREATGVPRPISLWRFDTDTRDEYGAMHGLDAVGFTARPGSRKSLIATAKLPVTIKEKTLAAWVRFDKPSDKSATFFEIRNLSGYRGASVDGIQYNGGKKRTWTNTSVGGFRTQEVGNEPEPGGLVHLAIAYDADGTIRIYRNGAPYGKSYVPDPSTPAGRLQTYFANDAVAKFSVSADAGLEEAALYDRALSGAEIARLFGAGIEIHQPSENARLAVATLEAELASLRAQLAAIPEPNLVFAAAVKPAEPTHVLIRGDVERRGEQVGPAGLSCLDGREAKDRRELAEWIASDSNPLFARTIVNRIWHYHFGAGMVENPNDLGFNGGDPSHPELLDTLAAELVRNDWSLKKLPRAIVLSQTYRQSSAFRAEAAAKDAGSRLLWRFPPQRLEAEVVRDSMLAASGTLNPKMGGPAFRPFELKKTGSYQNYQPVESDNTEHQRRTIYRMNVNTGGHPMLEALDCPMPIVKAPRRPVTTTALQALSLMNNDLVQRQAKAFAARLEREAPAGDARIALGFQLALGRAPDASEMNWSRELIRQHGLDQLCWGLFNTSEFLYAR